MLVHAVCSPPQAGSIPAITIQKEAVYEVSYSRHHCRHHHDRGCIHAWQAPALPAPEGEGRYVLDFWVKE